MNQTKNVGIHMELLPYSSNVFFKECITYHKLHIYIYITNKCVTVLIHYNGNKYICQKRCVSHHSLMMYIFKHVLTVVSTCDFCTLAFMVHLVISSSGRDEKISPGLTYILMEVSHMVLQIVSLTGM